MDATSKDMRLIIKQNEKKHYKSTSKRGHPLDDMCQFLPVFVLFHHMCFPRSRN